GVPPVPALRPRASHQLATPPGRACRTGVPGLDARRLTDGRHTAAKYSSPATLSDRMRPLEPSTCGTVATDRHADRSHREAGSFPDDGGAAVVTHLVTHPQAERPWPRALTASARLRTCEPAASARGPGDCLLTLRKREVPDLARCHPAEQRGH